MKSIRFSHLITLIQSCKKEDRKSQKELYGKFFGYGLSIALRYSESKEEAVEILNDAFMKVFVGGIQKYNEKENDHEGYFKNWLKRIIINTALDAYRKNKKKGIQQQLSEDYLVNAFIVEANAITNMSFEEILKVVKQLTPGYYTVFCLFVIDGFTHQEIAEKLNIAVGTSKSNLTKAKLRLQELLKHHNIEVYGRNIG